VSYKFIDSRKGSNDDLGDIAIGVGPRGRIGNLHWATWGALSFPTGDWDDKVAVGSGRLDRKLGGAFTYKPNQKFEVDGVMEYSFTGDDKNGRNAPNELYTGLLAGRSIGGRYKLGIGATNLVRGDGNSLKNGRLILRYERGKSVNYEIVLDRGIGGSGIPKGTSIGFFQRYNF
jgi:hypothetical protein